MSLYYLLNPTLQSFKKNNHFFSHFTNDIHYEVELLVRINKIGKHIQTKFAPKYYDEIGLELISPQDHFKMN